MGGHGGVRSVQSHSSDNSSSGDMGVIVVPPDTSSSGFTPSHLLPTSNLSFLSLFLSLNFYSCH